MMRGFGPLAVLFVIALTVFACSEPIPYPGEPTPATPSHSPGPLVDRASPPPIPSPEPWTVPPPELPEGIELTELEMGEPTVLPPGTALILSAHCAVCDPQGPVLLRVYQRASAGDPEIELLFPTDELGLPELIHPGPDRTEVSLPPLIAGYAMTSDASVIAVGVCTRPSCEHPDLDGEVTVYRSVDGGVTWRDIAVLPGDRAVVGADWEGSVIAVQQVLASLPYFRVPGGERLEQPERAAGGPPSVSPGGELLWLGSRGELMRTDGTLFSRIPVADEHNTQVGSQAVQPGRAMALTTITWAPPEPLTLLYVFDAEGRLLDAVTGPMTQLGGWLESDVLIGNADHSQQGNLVMIDLEEGSVRPLPVRFKPEYVGEHVHAVMPGPLMRVHSTGDCLNVRAQPGFGTPVLDCAADGVLLRDAGEERTVDGILWRRIVTPAGIEGWSSAEYLER